MLQRFHTEGRDGSRRLGWWVKTSILLHDFIQLQALLAVPPSEAPGRPAASLETSVCWIMLGEDLAPPHNGVEYSREGRMRMAWLLRVKLRGELLPDLEVARKLPFWSTCLGSTFSRQVLRFAGEMPHYRCITRLRRSSLGQPCSFSRHCFPTYSVSMEYRQ